MRTAIRYRLAALTLTTALLGGVGTALGPAQSAHAAISQRQASSILDRAPSNAARVAIVFAWFAQGRPYSQDLQRRFGPDVYDCSGLVWRAYAQSGIDLGAPNRNTQSIIKDRRVRFIGRTAANALPGDLIFFSLPAGIPNGHVAIYLGNNQMVEASSRGGMVRVRDYSDYNRYVSGYYRVQAP